MFNFSGSTLELVSGICFVVSVVFAVLIIGQIISILVLRSRKQKRSRSQKLFSLAGFFLFALGSSSIWIIVCPILIIIYTILSIFLVPYLADIVEGPSVAFAMAAPAAEEFLEPEPEPEP